MHGAHFCSVGLDVVPPHPQAACDVLFPFCSRPLGTFHSGEEPEPVVVVPILAEGRDALVAVSQLHDGFVTRILTSNRQLRSLTPSIESCVSGVEVAFYAMGGNGVRVTFSCRVASWLRLCSQPDLLSVRSTFKSKREKRSSRRASLKILNLAFRCNGSQNSASCFT